MLALLDTSQDLAAAARDFPASITVGQLLTPLSKFRNRAAAANRPWAIDNGAYSRFNPDAYTTLIERETPRRSTCTFLAAPDVVGSGRRTLELFRHWYPKLERWPIALVMQNGVEELDIPWQLIAAAFIGGDDRWKTSRAARDICSTARAMGKWIHVGRVNGNARFEVVEEMHAQSIDGKGIALYSRWRRRLVDPHPRLFANSLTSPPTVAHKEQL
jgi:hypothetical protein